MHEWIMLFPGVMDYCCDLNESSPIDSCILECLTAIPWNFLMKIKRENLVGGGMLRGGVGWGWVLMF